MKILLERNDVNHNAPDNRSQIPLLCGASNGHEPVVKILLEQDDVDPDRPSQYGHRCSYALVGMGTRERVRPFATSPFRRFVFSPIHLLPYSPFRRFFSSCFPVSLPAVSSFTHSNYFYINHITLASDLY